MNFSDYLPWLGTILTFLGGGGILTRFVLTRNEKIKVQADAATSTANAAKAQAEANEKRFEVSKQEYVYANERIDRLIAENTRLDTKVTAIQERADKTEDAYRTKITDLEHQADITNRSLSAQTRKNEALEALVDKLKGDVNETGRRCDALQTHIEDFYAALAIEPMPVQERIKKRMRTGRPYRDPPKAADPATVDKEEIQ